LQKTRLNYRLDSLSFGLGNSSFDFPISHKSKNIESYINELEGDFNTRKLVQDFETKGERLNFFNHLKIIPVSSRRGRARPARPTGTRSGRGGPSTASPPRRPCS
jgi:hypothetical protein